jgi:deoxycytidine triphosphate deaminase
MIIVRSKFDDHEIVIDPLPTEGAGDGQQAVVDLHVEHAYCESGKSIVVRPNECLVLSTKEELELPGDVLGLLCARDSLGSRGLLLANTRVDPGFKGSLKIPVFNANSHDLEIEQDGAFCSILFFKVEESAEADARKPRGLLARLRPHRDMVIGIIGLITAVIALITAIVDWSPVP